MSWEKELSQRLLRVIPLSEKSINYVKEAKEDQEELLTHKILLSLAKMVNEKREPIKLRDIVDDLYTSPSKRKMDIVRQLIKKTLIPSGIVEKLSLGKKDIRYLPCGYRFQETQRVESSSGKSIREPVGPVIEIPREHFPVPSEVLKMHLQKTSLERVLNKIDKDFEQEKISEPLYQKMRTEYQKLTETVCEQLKEYEELIKLLDLED